VKKSRVPTAIAEAARDEAYAAALAPTTAAWRSPAARPPATGPPVRLMSKAEVLDLVGCTYGSLWSWMKAGRFPLPIELGPPNGRSSKIAWLEHEITGWIASRPRRRLNKEEVA
jgi:predicted DNA-binding transcriptional regulator AlpA